MDHLEELCGDFNKVKMEQLVTFLHQDKPGLPQWPLNSEQCLKFVAHYLVSKQEPKLERPVYPPGESPVEIITREVPKDPVRPDKFRQRYSQYFDDKLFKLLADEVVLILDGKEIQLKNISFYKIEFPYHGPFVQYGLMKKLARIVSKLFLGSKYSKDYVALFQHAVLIDYYQGGVLIPTKDGCDELQLRNPVFGVSISVPYDGDGSIDLILFKYMAEYTKVCAKHRFDCGVKQVADPIGNPYTCRSILQRGEATFDYHKMAYLCRVLFARFDRPVKGEVDSDKR